jgi:alkylation response protein AidB-like acyl-CoA dehydrogenase
MELSARQKQRQIEYREFTDALIVPDAGQWDREERLPSEIVAELARHQYLGALAPVSAGGAGCDMVEFGLLNEELGRGCSSVRSLLTVHSMVVATLLRWGSESQKAQWLEKLARGEVIGAFALTEAEAGSDARAIQLQAVKHGDEFVLNGEKKWISLAQIAGVFLVFAASVGGPCAFLVERDTRGLTVSPRFGLLGARASMMAELHFEECRIPKKNMVGGPGFGLSYVASSALDCGRYSVGWGCVGIAEACLHASLQHTGTRKQFGTLLKDQQLVQRMLTQMIVGSKAARLLCYHAGRLKDAGEPSAVIETTVAKYFACKAAAEAARDTVQLHGAAGCAADHVAQRLFRDAKLMEIIEGTNEIHEINIAQNASREMGMHVAGSVTGAGQAK